MKIVLDTPLHLHEQGKRKNNEDYLYPPPGHAMDGDRLFLVCDGIGGAKKGEVASRLACEAFANYLKKHPVKVPDQAYLDKALAEVESEFDDYLQENPSAAGMGTTMTLLYLHAEGATYAHIGDSRVYHLQQGKLEQLTKDHSFVNELLEAGVINEEEAKEHPKRNVITRAIQGAEGGRSTTIAVGHIQELQKGDLFLLCTDGITEACSSSTLELILTDEEHSLKQKIEQIAQQCQRYAQDNYTAYFVPLKEVKKAEVPLAEQEPSTHSAPSAIVQAIKMVPSRLSNGKRGLFTWGAALIIFAAVLMWRFGPVPAKQEKPENVSIEKENDSQPPVSEGAEQGASGKATNTKAETKEEEAPAAPAPKQGRSQDSMTNASNADEKSDTSASSHNEHQEDDL